MTSRKRRALAPCEECGKVSRRVVGRPLCAECLGYESNKLEGGRWVIDLRRRVLVWQEDAA